MVKQGLSVLLAAVAVVVVQESSTTLLAASGQTIACKNVEWVDDEGYDCFDYDETPEWCEEFGECLFEGSSANEACCICGGGDTFALDGPPTPAPIIEIVPGQKNCVLSPAIEIAEGLTIQNVVDYERGLFTMKLEYSGNAWIGIGFENDGRPGKPTFAVIGRVLGEVEGVPTTSVLKYALNTANEDASGVVEMSQGSQTLEDATFLQFNDKSTLTFTKPLNEDYDIPEQIVTDTTTWVYAVGLPNNAWAGRHTMAGSFNLALTPCFNYEWEITNPSVNGGLVDANALNSRTYFGEKPYKLLWILHGAILTFAWGVLCPLGIACAFLKRKTKSWFRLHQAANNGTLLLTCIGILLAVIATYMDDRSAHLSTDHAWFGLGVFCALLIETILAFGAPSLNYGNKKKKRATGNGKHMDPPRKEKERDVILGIGGNLEVLPSDSPHNPRNKNKKSNLYSPRQEEPPIEQDQDSVRELPTGRGCGCCAWLHRVLGYLAVAGAWYTCYTGMDWQIFHFDLDWSWYYAAAAAVGVAFMILAFLLSCCMKDIPVEEPRSSPQQQPEEFVKPLGAQDSMAAQQQQRSFFNDDETPEDDSSDESSYEEKTLHDLEDADGQRSPIRKSWDIDTCCL